MLAHVAFRQFMTVWPNREEPGGQRTTWLWIDGHRVLPSTYMLLLLDMDTNHFWDGPIGVAQTIRKWCAKELQVVDLIQTVKSNRTNMQRPNKFPIMLTSTFHSVNVKGKKSRQQKQGH